MSLFLTSDHKDEKKEREKWEKTKKENREGLWLVAVSDMLATALFEVFADL